MPSRRRVILNEAGTRAYARLASGVARELEKIIEAAGLKRSDVAQKAGLDKAALTRILDGTRNLELRTIAAVLSATGHVMDVKTVDTKPSFDNKKSNAGRPISSGNAGAQSPFDSAPAKKAVNVDVAKTTAQAIATSPYSTSMSMLSIQAKTKTIEAQQ